MLYHIRMGIPSIEEWKYNNESREDVLSKFLCPFISREMTFLENEIFNMSSLGYIRIFKTEKPIDSDWPINKENFKKAHLKKVKFGDITLKYEYERELIKILEEGDVTKELYREAIILIETGKYKELRAKILEETKGKYSFFVYPFENKDVDHNYEYVIKPTVKQYQFEIQRIDEISTTDEITDDILNSISKSRFIVADLTDARPNCYYEVGYAHSLGKPVIILAKEGTKRHFDISGYKWNYWKDYKDLKTKFEKELNGVLQILGFLT